MKQKTSFVSKFGMIVCLLFLTPAVNFSSAQESTSGKNSGRAPTADWSVITRGGYVHQLDTDIDSGGSFSVNRFFVQAGPNFLSGEGTGITLAIGYGLDSYDFSDKTRFGGWQPWDDIHSFRFSIPWRWKINEHWRGFISPTLRYAGTEGVDFDDATTGGGFAAFSYRYSDHLSIGPGLGVLTQLENNTQVIPILVIKWKISDTLSLQTGRGIGATLGPGLTLAWRPTNEWSFTLGGRYEKLRFRLAENETVNNGIGEDRSFPIFSSIEYLVTSKVHVSLMGGINVGGTLRLEDSQGSTIIEQNHDTAGFLGMAFGAIF